MTNVEFEEWSQGMLDRFMSAILAVMKDFPGEIEVSIESLVKGAWLLGLNSIPFHLLSKEVCDFSTFESEFVENIPV